MNAHLQAIPRKHNSFHSTSQLISTLVIGFPDHVPLFRAITLNKSGAQDLELPCHKLGKRRVPQHRLSYAGFQMAFQGRDSFGFPKAS